MDGDRWHRIQEIFHTALELPEGERAAFVAAACMDDEPLEQRVHAMLDADARDAFLDADVARVAGGVLAAGTGGPDVSSAIGPYRIKALLGEGGSGVVYLAERADIGHDVAIKVLRDAWVSAHRRDRFLSEQRTLAKLNHPAIARILDAGILSGGTPWFALERIDGLRLDEYCRRHVTDLPGLTRLFRTICDAVQHAHERLIVHRDLKPSNILVTAAGQPKLLDFGIARQIEELGSAGGQTGPLRVLTPGYASPEELRGEPPGVRGDVFSLGRILGDLLTELETTEGAPSGWRSRWAAGLSGSALRDARLICDTASHPDPDARYPTVAALGRDLDAVIHGRPIEARPATYRYRARKFLGRNRRRIAAAAIILAVIGGLTAAYARRLALAQSATAVQAARSDRLLRFVLGLFEGGDRGGAPPADLRVVSLLERGVREARDLDDDPRAQAEMFFTLGRVYQELGDLERAEDLLAAALDHRLTRPDAAPADVVSSLVAMSELRLDQSRLDEAQQLAEDALARAARTLAPTDPARLGALLALGRTQRDKGEYESATATLREALGGTAPASATGLHGADTLNALSETRFYVGDFDGAEAFANQAISLRRLIGGVSHPSVAHTQLTLGAIATARGQHADAERLTREALDKFVAWFGEDHPESASAMTTLGQALASQKRFDEGMTLLQKALEVQVRTFGDRHPRTAYVHNAIGLMAFQADDLTRAATAFERAAEGYGSSAGTHYQEGVSLANLGSAYLAQGDNARAEGMFRRALEIYAAVLPADHVNVGIAQAKLGRALLRQRRAAEAEPVLLQAEQLLSRQATSSPTWLNSAREDLASARQRAQNRRDADR
jgi:serine/threonine-protein kinase